MAELAGITQSVSRAWHLLNQTGIFDLSRGMHTEAWQNNVRNAVRELQEAARSLVRANNRDAYGELSNSLRGQLWQSILLARAPATGAYIISRLGAQYSEMPQHVREARTALSSHSRGFRGSILQRMTSTILDAAPTRVTAVEQEAARQGDPMPIGITAEEAQLYQRIVLRAIQQSTREANTHRNAGEAALEAFGETFLPALPGPDTAAIMQGRVEGSLAAAVSRGGEVASREAANRIGAVVSVIRALSAAADAHYRATHPEYRLNYWIFQGCLRASNNDNAAANRLGHRLQDIKRRMNAWLEWLERHHEHPSYVPPYGTIDAAPTASVDTSDLTQNGVANRCGPVQGSVRGATIRGPTGFA